MNLIVILNISSFLILLSIVIILLYKYFKVLKKDPSIILIIITFGIALLVTFTNLLEHSGIAIHLDTFEDELDILFIPMFIFAIFSFNLKKELRTNIENKKKLEESNIRLNMSIEGANEALWEWLKNESKLLINKKYNFLSFEPFSYVIDEQNRREIIHPDSQFAYSQLIDIFESNSDIPCNTEIQIKTKEEDFRWILIKGKKCDLLIEDQHITFLGTMYDIGNFKIIQTELNESKIKAEESDKLKTAFLTNLSHEIRTPMNGIMGFSDLLKDSYLNSSKKNDFINNIQVSGQRLLSIIDDIVEMSQLDSGQIILHKTSVTIDKILKNVVHELKMSLPHDKNLNLFLNNPSDNPIITITDEIKLQQIVANLINNAIKYTSEGSIEVGYKLDEKSGSIEFSVKDSGMGIDKQYHEIIFERFRQLDVNYNNLSGLGLGLSICKAYVEMLGGKIWVESEVDKGSVFYFTIPYVTAETVKKIQKNTEDLPDTLQNKLILVAEDDEANFLYIHEVLKSCKCKVLRTVNGIETIKACKENQSIDLVLMDIKMPLLNGIEATKEIKIFRPDLPIIAQTAYAFPDDERRVKEAGCNAYISKPIHRDKIIKLMIQILQKA